MIDQNILEHLAVKRVTAEEISQLRTACQQITQKSDLIEKIETQLGKDFLNGIKETYLLDDWEWFADEFIKASNSSSDSQLWWLLMISRCFGLIEFSRLRTLRKMKIRVLGASVAAATVELLASLGCEDITCIDPGILE